MRFDVRVHPRAARPRVERRDGVIHVWLREPPVEGAANRALLRALSVELGVPESRLRVAAGSRGRTKLVELAD